MMPVRSTERPLRLTDERGYRTAMRSFGIFTVSQVDGVRLHLECIEVGGNDDVAALDTLQYLVFGEDRHMSSLHDYLQSFDRFLRFVLALEDIHDLLEEFRVFLLSAIVCGFRQCDFDRLMRTLSLQHLFYCRVLIVIDVRVGNRMRIYARTYFQFLSENVLKKRKSCDIRRETKHHIIRAHHIM